MIRTALLVLALAACRPPCDGYEVRSLCVDDSNLSREQAERVRLSIDAVVLDGLAWWSADASALDGWRLVWLKHGAAVEWDGNTDYGEQLIYLVEPAEVLCGEFALSALPHEIGHAVGNREHDDPRWRGEWTVLEPIYSRCTP
jgi:hypothetical protein